MNASATKQPRATSRSRSIVYAALGVALMAVASWITVPIGAVPVTLQVLAVAFVLFTLSPREAIASIAAYIALGAIGLPVFAGFKGGLAALMGPTGGFILGFLLAGGLALVVGTLLERVPAFSGQETKSLFGTPIKSGDLARYLVMGAVFLVVLYLFGWIQLMAVANLGPVEAFAAAIAPFVLIDIAKIILAVILSQTVKAAIQQ